MSGDFSELLLDDFLCPPPRAARVPPFAAGWLDADGQTRAYLNYLEGAEEHGINWSEDLEQLHESTRVHFIDAWTRRAVLDRLGSLPRHAAMIDVGCSTGYLLEDLCRRAPHITPIGLDPIASGLGKAHEVVPQVPLLQADVCALPLLDASMHALVSVNVLEHVDDDERALAEIFRVLRPGARAVIVIPLDPGSYNYYDQLLGHQRRYARGELARKGRAAGLRVLEDICLGALLYPAFRFVKRRNQKRYGHLSKKEIERRVQQEIESTTDSRLGAIACATEERLLRRGLALPFGIRGLTVLERPAD